MKSIFWPELAVSVTSGAIVAAGASLLNAFDPAALSIPAPALVATGAIPATAVFTYLLARRSDRSAGQVFISISAITHTRWLADLLTNLSRSLDAHGLDSVVKLPPHDHSGRLQLAQLAALRRRRGAYVGGFFISTEPERMPRELAAMCRRIDRPVVFVDVRPFPVAVEYPAGTAFVGCDPEQIGATAARWVTTAMIRRGVRRPVILVVAGDAQEGRQRRFEEVLRESLPGSTITVNAQGQFARERAREIVGHYLRQGLEHSERLDAIFCTNDEMALGAVDAVQTRNTTSGTNDDPVIIGVDGIPEAISTIRAGNTPFRATIAQDTRQIAEVAVDTLARLRSGESIATEIYVPASVYPG